MTLVIGLMNKTIHSKGSGLEVKADDVFEDHTLTSSSTQIIVKESATFPPFTLHLQ